MTNDNFLKECKFIANDVLRFKYENLDSVIDKSIRVLKSRRKDQARANFSDFDDNMFNHYAKQYIPLVRAMVYALEHKENFK